MSRAISSQVATPRLWASSSESTINPTSQRGSYSGRAADVIDHGPPSHQLRVDVANTMKLDGGHHLVHERGLVLVDPADRGICDAGYRDLAATRGIRVHDVEAP